VDLRILLESLLITTYTIDHRRMGINTAFDNSSRDMMFCFVAGGIVCDVLVVTVLEGKNGFFCVFIAP
jgi:hypothetical protein